MSWYDRNATPSNNYNSGKSKVLQNLEIMKQAAQKMGAEHVKFHENFTDVQKRLEHMKKTYGSSELDSEVIRATALEAYLSDGNHPKVLAFGRLELEKSLKEFKQEEQKLDDLQKKTAQLVEALSGGRVASHTKCEN